MPRARVRARPEGAPPRLIRCLACARDLANPSDIGWECDCGVVVCAREECIALYFRFIAGGEATRCLSCGAVL
jgi:hypothetical protein